MRYVVAGKGRGASRAVAGWGARLAPASGSLACATCSSSLALAPAGSGAVCLLSAAVAAIPGGSGASLSHFTTIRSHQKVVGLRPPLRAFMPARCVWLRRLALRCSFPPRQLPPPPRSGIVGKGGVVLWPRRKATKQNAPSFHAAPARTAGSPCKQVGLRPPRVHAGAYHPRAPRQPAPCARQAGPPSRVPVIHGLSAGVVCGVLASSAAAPERKKPWQANE